MLVPQFPSRLSPVRARSPAPKESKNFGVWQFARRHLPLHTTTISTTSNDVACNCARILEARRSRVLHATREFLIARSREKSVRSPVARNENVVAVVAHFVAPFQLTIQTAELRCDGGLHSLVREREAQCECRSGRFRR